MIKIFKRFCIIGSIFLMSCSGAEVDNEFDFIIDETSESKSTYIISGADGTYQLSNYSNTSNIKTNNLLTGKIDSYSETETELPNADKLEFDFIRIDHFENNQVHIIAAYYIDADEGAIKTSFTWKSRYEIIEGSYESYVQGETIKVKAIPDAEYDKAISLFQKATYSKAFGADPYKSNAKSTSLSDIMLINQNEIIATGSSKTHVELKYSKEVKDIKKLESKN